MTERETWALFDGGIADGGCHQAPILSDGNPAQYAIIKGPPGSKTHFHYRRTDTTTVTHTRTYWHYQYVEECSK